MIRKEGPVELLGRSAKTVLSSAQTELGLRELYETMYGIYDHDRPDARMRPLALVALHPKENTSSYSPLYRRIDRFKRLRMYELFGMPLDRFLAMPTEYVEYCFRLAEISTHEEGKKTEEVLREMREDKPGKPQ